MRFVLASKSPRRKELLKKIIPDFDIRVSDADETVEETDCSSTVMVLSRRKALAVDAHEDEVVIGADTLVEFEGDALGKPSDREDARDMLMKLSGNRHLVHTGVTIRYGKEIRSFVETTEVWFGNIRKEDLSGISTMRNTLTRQGHTGYRMMQPSSWRG
ncbi:MAG: Maf family protein [Clostridia bacterium]|nr:Maf family protein [Clostridia bacterium]